MFIVLLLPASTCVARLYPKSIPVIAVVPVLVMVTALSLIVVVYVTPAGVVLAEVLIPTLATVNVPIEVTLLKRMLLPAPLRFPIPQLVAEDRFHGAVEAVLLPKTMVLVVAPDEPPISFPVSKMAAVTGVAINIIPNAVLEILF